ncbi:ABC transporter permease [Microlunatus ginsengisoli]|jgi:osmoprotectant transport system permease protein|uniref:Glycine betaine/carnitine/choline/L-proline ABC transporter permease ProZ n=1 Tax=Microlunatus ginsengisoli TaxID=363863 RepID=A0ABP7AQ32_9ACTN
MSLFSYLLDPANWGPNGIITKLLLQHLYYTIAAVLIAAVIAIPVGIVVGHTGRGSYLVVGVSNSARAIPSLGLLVLAVLALGTSSGPIIGVLAILALPSILTGTAVGIQNADHEAVHAARALGMTGGQIVGKVEWPLALPLVISGLRVATLQVVATATVAGFAAGGGLGQLLISGQATQNYSQMFAGAVLVAALAIFFDLALGLLGWFAARKTHPRAKTRVRRQPQPT